MSQPADQQHDRTPLLQLIAEQLVDDYLNELNDDREEEYDQQD